MSFELNRKLAAKRDPMPTSADIDPVTAEIIRGAFETVCFEAATYLGRAASSPIINQSNERNAAIVDGNGRLAMGAVGTPHLTFVNQMETRWGLMNMDRYDWGPGDVFLANDPDHGGGHLPDYCVYGPVYDDKGELICIQTLQAHQGDTGGKDPGGFTLEATDIFTEGVIYPCLKLVHRGEMRMDAFDFVVRNNRFATFAGDIAAMIGGVQYANEMLESLIEKWSAETIKAAINHSIEHTERRVREEVSRWADGVYEATVLIDHDTAGTKDVKVHVTCTIEGDQLTVDLTGTDDRQDLVGVWNTFANSRSYVLAQIIAAMDPTITKNEGFFNVIDIILPEGCIAHPPPNKPAALGSFHPACEITEAVCIALSNVAPERAQPQLYKIGMPNSVVGFYENGLMWMDQGVDCRSMDTSAVQGIDGWGSAPCALANLLLSQAEDAESRFPIINISREMKTDGGGAGQWRGLPGSLNVKQVLEPTTAVAWMVSADHPLRGMCGGDDAIPYENHFEVGSENERKIEHTAQDLLPEGAVIAYQHGGGAGFGPPLLRDPDAIKEDVLDEYVSLDAAHSKYGVVFTGSLENYDLEVNRDATEALRKDMGVDELLREAAE